MCDGYNFPLGASASGNPQALEAMCQAGCPDATVKLFSVRPGAADITDAVSRDRQVYGKLPVAFAYRQQVSQACTCRRSGSEGTRVSLLQDATLRPGDVVVLDNTAKVFTGGTAPHAKRDFADFRGARTLSKSARREVDEIVGATSSEVIGRKFSAELRRQARADLRSDATTDAQGADAGTVRVISQRISARP